MSMIHPASHAAEAVPAQCRICFVGVENKSAEELGDFKEQIYQQIDTQIQEQLIVELYSK